MNSSSTSVMFSGAGLGYIVIADAFSLESPNFHLCCCEHI